jgi:uncharacterized protein YcbX
MNIVGTVESLWRYPVKSMRGEEVNEIFAGIGGVEGDRLFAFKSSANRAEFPYFTARERRQMLRYRPRLRRPNEQSIEVETPSGQTFAIDDPALIDDLRRDVDQKHEVTLLRAERAMTDTHPISLFSLQTARQLREEVGTPVDKRCFRANIYLDLTNSPGFSEDEFVGRSLRIGEEVVISILARDARCVMINLDPDTAAMTPTVLKTVAQLHDGRAGVYGSVLVEGMLRKGDRVELLKQAD